MTKHLLYLPLLLATILSVSGSENSLGTIYQPLDPMVDGSVVVRAVPFVKSGPYPEIYFDSITRPHIPQQSSLYPVGDINVASRAGISITCESATAGQTKLYIIWDFSKATGVNEDLINALLMCLEKTAGKSIGLYSKFVGAEKYPAFKQLIESRIPLQTEQQRKLDSVGPAVAFETKFRHHFIDKTLPQNERLQGDYGLTALVDIDRDGDLDYVVGGRQPAPELLYWFEFKSADEWVRHDVGTGYQSDVGLAALDVDGDGWSDLVCSGVWYRNSGKPRDGKWERFEFAKKAGGAHDIVAADMDGDGRKDIVMMSDARTPLNALCWFKIPADPRQLWERHDIGAGIHGAITPGGVGDINGDGHTDVVRGDTWFENKNGKGLEWITHANIPMGRKGPFGVCVRTAIADIDGDGKKAIVMCDADIDLSKIVILRNPDGKGEAWTKQELPQSFPYGSLHSLAVADFNKDGRLDIVSNEQEELLPPGRENPRWIMWENLGQQKFAERILLDTKLGGHELQSSDVDGDGDTDIVSKAWGCLRWNGLGGKMHVDFLENLAVVK